MEYVKIWAKNDPIIGALGYYNYYSNKLGHWAHYKLNPNDPRAHELTMADVEAHNRRKAERKKNIKMGEAMEVTPPDDKRGRKRTISDIDSVRKALSFARSVGTQTGSSRKKMKNGRRVVSKVSRMSRKSRKSRGTRSKRRGSSKKYSKRTSRRGVRGLAGGSAIVGGRDEEDPAVKAHMKSGVVVEYGVSGNLDSAVSTHRYSSMSLVHSTVPQIQLMEALCVSLIKTLFIRAGYHVKNIGDPVGNTGFGIGVLSLYVDYYYGIAGAHSQFDIQITPGTTTYYVAAVDLASKFLSRSANRAQELVKFGKAWLASPDTGTNWLSSIDLDVCRFKIDIVSNLVYQNRTVADDNSSSATDIDQVPLFEVQTYGNGSGPISNDGSIRGTGIQSFFVDAKTGILGVKHGNAAGVVDKFLTAEPSKGTWQNSKRIIDTIANPGVVKQSKLKSRYNFTFTKLIPYFRFWSEDGSIPLNPLTHRTYSKLGKYKHLWFRKTISIGSTLTNIPVQIAYQHHWAVGITCKYKENNRTVAYVANEQ